MKTRFTVYRIQAKTILTRSKIPGITYVLNPYLGCTIGCRYCYAAYMGRNIGKTVLDWGSYVCVKGNAAECLKKELPKAFQKPGTILISSVTDPYQEIEATEQLTRRCIEILSSSEFPGCVSFLTKSILIKRDLPLIKALKNKEVGMTITGLDDVNYEGYSSKPASRLATLAEFSKNGIRVYVFLAPLLPRYYAQPTKIIPVIEKIAEAGIKEVLIDFMNASWTVKQRWNGESLSPCFNKSKRDDLKKILFQTIASCGLILRNDG